MGILCWKKNQPNNDEPLGARGEKLAAQYLKSKGYRIREMNFKNSRGRRVGEIDIVAEKDGAIVFVEVKTREKEKYQTTLPEENISPDKLRKLAKIGAIYIAQQKLWDQSYHFDAIAVWLDPVSGVHEIKHLEHIFI